jgi:heme oxygenase (biliverdin-IX-beta and delta-forming)
MDRAGGHQDCQSMNAQVGQMEECAERIRRTSRISTSESVRDTLRNSTHSHHVRLNRHPLLSELTRPGLQPASYATIVGAYRGYFSVVEPALERYLMHNPNPFDYAPRRKLPWLDADIAHFPDAPAMNAPPDELVALAQISEPGDLIGLLYAMEGSTLGGQVIARHLYDHVGLTEHSGARYFAAYGPDTEARWHEFCAFAETIRDNDHQLVRARASAILAFVALERCLDL